MMKRSPFKFHYELKFNDGRVTEYNISLDAETLSLIPTDRDQVPPDWAKLDFKQCRCCPLKPNTHPHCPICLNIMELVDSFKNVFSYHDCMVVCKAPERTYSKNTSTMEGLSTIFGVIMATSDCPIMEFLKPMARFHLPFATIEETTVRSASLYLLGQYFMHKDQSDMKIDFKILEKHYTKVQQVNEGLLERINSLGSEDADKNAIVTLHSLSQFLSMEIDYSLGSLEYIFAGRYTE